MIRTTLRTLYILIIIPVLSPSIIFSQVSQFRNYTVKDGLPSSEVYYVMQDSKGYMWFCTDLGVCKFDGYEFKTFNSTNGLPGNTFFECHEDYKGRVWFISLSGKLSYYYHDSIFLLDVNDTLPSILKTSFINGFNVDKEDNIYLGSSGTNGIIHIDLRKKHSICLITLPRKIYYAGVSSTGVIFGNTIPNSGKWEKPDDTISISILSLHSNSYKLSNILLWKRQVLYLVDKSDMAIKLTGDKIATSLYSAFIISDSGKIVFTHVFNSNILKLYKAPNEDIWIILKDNAPVIYRKGKIIEPHNINFLSDKHITSATVDKEGGVWFSSMEFGVFYLPFPDMEIWNTGNGLVNNKTTGLYVAPDSSLWTVQENSKTFSIIQHDSVKYLKIPNNWPDCSISSVLFNTDGSKWISTTAGMYLFSDKNKLLARAEKFIVSLNKIQAKDKNSVWASGYSLLYAIKQKADSTTHEDLASLKTKIFSLCEDSEKNLWLGTRNGLYEYAHDSLIYWGNKSPLFQNIFTDIKYIEGQLWMTTGDNGVIVKLSDTTTIHITAINGLPSNFCQCIYISDNKDIWVGTNKGLSRIIVNNISNGIRGIAVKNITSFNLIEVNAITSVGKRLFAGTNGGVIAFNTSTGLTNTLAPAIYITEVKINDKVIASDTGTIHLPYNENYIILNYRGLTYRDAGHTQYRYRMSGIDTAWHYTKNTNVQYPRLTPGNYTFLVSAMNTDGIWNSIPARISFIIAPPFWSTWWARVLIISLVALFIYWRIKLIENREKKKTEINKQLATLELKELEKQLDPHFLFNNLGALKYLIDANSSDAQYFVDELSQFYRYNLMRRNKGLTELKNEIEQAKRYMNLVKIRFGEQVLVKWNINEKMMDYYIPPFSLQLSLENITKHNIISSEEPLLVEITTDDHSITVRNQLRPKKINIASTGHGLKNINEHYKLETGEEITINKSSAFFSITLPLIPPEKYESANH